MKWIAGASLAIVVFLFVGMGVIAKNRSAEELLIGSWKEVSWQYGKYERNEQHDKQWQEVSQNLIVHKAEVWDFNNNNTFVIYPRKNDKTTITGNWHVKGRGNILELTEGNIVEHYQIENITQDSLIVYFSFDLQVRSIVKITFKRAR